MADMILYPYRESGTTPGWNYRVFLDILQNAKPQDSAEIKTLTPYKANYSYSVFVKQAGTKWQISGIQRLDVLEGAHWMGWYTEYLRTHLQYIWKVHAVDANLPYDVQELLGKYLRVESMSTKEAIKDNIQEFDIIAREVQML
jgi:hypothetical protein